jgi:hypothetical protein
MSANLAGQAQSGRIGIDRHWCGWHRDEAMGRALVSVVAQSSRRGRIKAKTVCAMPDKYAIAPHGLVRMRDMEVFPSAPI